MHFKSKLMMEKHSSESWRKPCYSFQPNNVKEKPMTGVRSTLKILDDRYFAWYFSLLIKQKQSRKSGWLCNMANAILQSIELNFN